MFAADFEVTEAFVDTATVESETERPACLFRGLAQSELAEICISEARKNARSPLLRGQMLEPVQVVVRSHLRDVCGVQSSHQVLSMWLLFVLAVPSPPR